MSKADRGVSAALSALNVGAREQGVRMPEKPQKPSPARTHQVNVRLTAEGQAMLQQAQQRVFARGLSAGKLYGATLEIVLAEWLAQTEV
jgi:hypothetical protein